MQAPVKIYMTTLTSVDADSERVGGSPLSAVQERTTLHFMILFSFSRKLLTPPWVDLKRRVP
ncbi:uncharacterized protein TRAVEDRAFT_25366 [Trametes versicolor FP-101664 SS1]|uniref:uncharacterized protein n=1 Tax=Trametes versicolor (strain FP-101664) TaxID=717944 RepID=UPI0004621AFC|nr:uncharacterized protein TRAVEDRAFT_25366 [Trametes versicolor FP-101664 SS1]EIW64050.1 hypothetical protein TRAVEDRAFT_25366 [Trametes versicolor FP-101664 SS1]